MFAGRTFAQQAQRPASSARLATPAARQLHSTVHAAAASSAPTATGEELSTHNGSTSISLSEGFKPFEEVIIGL